MFRVIREFFLRNGRVELSNNRAERSIKTFVIDRKNFLFANTLKGVTGSAVMFSLIQTAIENGLNPYKYLTWLLKAANNADLSQESVIQALLLRKCSNGMQNQVNRTVPALRPNSEQARFYMCWWFTFS